MRIPLPRQLPCHSPMWTELPACLAAVCAAVHDRAAEGAGTIEWLGYGQFTGAEFAVHASPIAAALALVDVIRNAPPDSHSGIIQSRHAYRRSAIPPSAASTISRATWRRDPVEQHAPMAEPSRVRRHNRSGVRRLSATRTVSTAATASIPAELLRVYPAERITARSVEQHAPPGMMPRLQRLTRSRAGVGGWKLVD